MVSRSITYNIHTTVYYITVTKTVYVWKMISSIDEWLNIFQNWTRWCSHMKIIWRSIIVQLSYSAKTITVVESSTLLNDDIHKIVCLTRQDFFLIHKHFVLIPTQMSLSICNFWILLQMLWQFFLEYRAQPKKDPWGKTINCYFVFQRFLIAAKFCILCSIRHLTLNLGETAHCFPGVMR